MKTEDIILTILAILIIGVIVYFGAKLTEERQAWLNENCTKIGEISGSSSVGIGIGSNGSTSMVPVYTPGKTGYKCNDGLEYWE